MGWDSTRKTDVTRVPTGAIEAALTFGGTAATVGKYLKTGLHTLYLSGTGQGKLQVSPYGEDPSQYPPGAKAWFDVTDVNGNIITYTASASVSPAQVFNVPEEFLAYRFVCTQGSVNVRISG